MGLREYRRPPSSTKCQHTPEYICSKSTGFNYFPDLTIHSKTRNVYYLNRINFRFILTLRHKSICKTIIIWFNIMIPLFLTATLHCGVHDAQTGNSRVPEEVQRKKETQGLLMSLFQSRHTCNWMHFICICLKTTAWFLCLPYDLFLASRVRYWPPCWCRAISLVSSHQSCYIEVVLRKTKPKGLNNHSTNPDCVSWTIWLID